ncbi:MAG: hypothetical protein H8E37_04030 [Planctomycetes bacterium]|nr:hypothetical protein [Planctomycetota bacterium]
MGYEFWLVLILVLVLTSPLWGGFLLLKKKSRVRYWLMRLVELRAIRRQVKSVRTRRTILPFAWAISLHVLLTSLVCWNVFAEPPKAVRGATMLAVGAAGYLCLVFTVVVHLVPNSSRQGKYSLALTGIVCFWSLFLGISRDSYFLDLLFHSSEWSNREFCLAVIALGPATLILVSCITWYFIRPGSDESPSHNLRTAYGLVTGLATPVAAATAIFSVVLIVPSVVYVVVRYLLGERLGKEPILYLRSFHDGDAATAYGGMINGITARFGVVVGLVHVQQRPSELHRLGSFLNHARFKTVPDEWWQEWVSAHLRRCSALVIDISMSTASVAWELDRALATVPRDQILILAEKGATVTPPADVPVIRYNVSQIEAAETTDAQVVSRAQKEMEAWFSQRFYGNAESARPRAAALLLGSLIAAGLVLSIAVGAYFSNQEDAEPKPVSYPVSVPQFIEIPNPIEMPDPIQIKPIMDQEELDRLFNSDAFRAGPLQGPKFDGIPLRPDDDLSPSDGDENEKTPDK